VTADTFKIRAQIAFRAAIDFGVVHGRILEEGHLLSNTYMKPFKIVTADTLKIVARFAFRAAVDHVKQIDLS
jgi:hypothetical protein